MLNTHTLLKELVAIGLSEKLAEDFVDNIVTKDQLKDSNEQLVTKSDLKIAVLELKTEINELRTEMRNDKKWIIPILIGMLTLMIKVAFFN